MSMPFTAGPQRPCLVKQVLFLMSITTESSRRLSLSLLSGRALGGHVRPGSQKQVLRSVFPHGLLQCLVPLPVHLPLLSQHAELLLLVLVDDLDLGEGLVLAAAADAEVVTAEADAEVITAAAAGG